MLKNCSAHIIYLLLCVYYLCHFLYILIFTPHDSGHCTTCQWLFWRMSMIDPLLFYITPYWKLFIAIIISNILWIKNKTLSSRSFHSSSLGIKVDHRQLDIFVLGYKRFILNYWKYKQYDYTSSCCSLQTLYQFSLSFLMIISINKINVNVISINNINVNVDSRYNSVIFFIFSLRQIIKSLLLLLFTQYTDWNIIICWCNWFVFSG